MESQHLDVITWSRRRISLDFVSQLHEVFHWKNTSCRSRWWAALCMGNRVELKEDNSRQSMRHHCPVRSEIRRLTVPDRRWLERVHLNVEQRFEPKTIWIVRQTRYEGAQQVNLIFDCNSPTLRPGCAHRCCQWRRWLRHFSVWRHCQDALCVRRRPQNACDQTSLHRQDLTRQWELVDNWPEWWFPPVDLTAMNNWESMTKSNNEGERSSLFSF